LTQANAICWPSRAAYAWFPAAPLVERRSQLGRRERVHARHHALAECIRDRCGQLAGHDVGDHSAHPAQPLALRNAPGHERIRIRDADVATGELAQGGQWQVLGLLDDAFVEVADVGHR